MWADTKGGRPVERVVVGCWGQQRLVLMSSGKKESLARGEDKVQGPETGNLF